MGTNRNPDWHVLVDFDGTIAPDDPTDRLLECFAAPAWREIEAAWQSGKISSRECLSRQVSLMRATPAALEQQICAVKVDPGFAGFLEFCRRRGGDVTIVSDGFDRVVQAALRNARLSVPYFANALEWRGDDQWHLGFPHAQEHCRNGSANCKCVHADWSSLTSHIVVGDGRSDFCMAGRADFVIAKGQLADYCRSRGQCHAAFADFKDETTHISLWLENRESTAREGIRSARTSTAEIDASPKQARSQAPRTDVTDESIRLDGGPTGFLLIHGLGGTPMEMRFVAQGLARAGHTVHVPQLAGHCGSAEELKATTWQHWYESVEIEHNRLRETCDSVVVGGLSMGAVLALHHAAQHPNDVSALALYAPSLWLDGWGVPWYSHLFKTITQKWLANAFRFAEREPWGVKDPRIRAIVEQAINSGDSSRAGIAALPGSVMLELRWLVKQVRREVGLVRQPVLIVHPRDDDRASLRNLEYLQTNLRGPIEAVVLDDSYHIVTIDRQRQLVVERTLEFLSQVDWRSRPLPDEEVSMEGLFDLRRA
jgi:carboxylesterase